MSSHPSFINIPERLKLSEEQWRFILRQAIYDLRVAEPGIIQSFDATHQTVTVQLAIRENINKNIVPTPTEIPIIVDVPIVLPRGGGWSFTVPIQQGDECLVIFADMCIDAWWQSGGVQNQIDRRRHDLSDGFAVLAPWSQPRVLPNYSTTSAQMRSDDGSVIVELAPSAVNITAQSIVLNGNVTIKGTALDVQSNTTINGRPFLGHEHTKGYQNNPTGGVI